MRIYNFMIIELKRVEVISTIRLFFLNFHKIKSNGDIECSRIFLHNPGSFRVCFYILFKKKA